MTHPDVQLYGRRGGGAAGARASPPCRRGGLVRLPHGDLVVEAADRAIADVDVHRAGLDTELALVVVETDIAGPRVNVTVLL